MCVQAGSKQSQRSNPKYKPTSLVLYLLPCQVRESQGCQIIQDRIDLLVVEVISLHVADTTKWSERIFFLDSLEVNPKELCWKMHTY